MIRVGVIGCGKIAQARHLPEYHANASAEIAGVFDLDAGRAAEMSEKYQTKVYASYESMLQDESIDAVSVCTANFSHCEIVLKALAAGKHVLCEKPMAVTLEQCEQMVDAAKKSGKFLMIGQNQRLTRTHQQARDLIAKGEIGKIVTFKSNFAHAGPESWAIDRNNVWFFDKKTAAFGAMADLGIHKTDLIRFLTGENIQSAMAVAKTIDKRDKDGNLISVDDNSICIYTLKSGAVGTMNVSWSCYGDEDNSTIIYGTEGCMKIYCDPKYSLILEKKDGQRVYYEIDKIQTNDQQTSSGVIDYWISCLENNQQPELSGEEVFHSMKAVFAALESARTERLVHVDELGR